MMKQISTVIFKEAVEAKYHCAATLAQSVYLKENFDGQTHFEGVVHVFDLVGCSKARRAYSWADGAEEESLLLSVILHFGPITGPREAVQAAVLAGADGRLTSGPKVKNRAAVTNRVPALA